MKFIFFVALGAILNGYGFSSGIKLPYYMGHFLGWSGVIISIGSSYLQYKNSLPYEYTFSKNNWIGEDGSYFLEVPIKIHKKIVSNVSVFTKADNTYRMILTDYNIRKNNNVVINTAFQFEGKIVIK